MKEPDYDWKVFWYAVALIVIVIGLTGFAAWLVGLVQFLSQ